MLLNISKFIGRQKWIVTGLRIRIIAKLIGDECRTVQRDFVVDFFGMRFAGNTGSYIDWRVFFLGAYDLLTLNVMKELFVSIPNAIALDVGANVGNHALFMSHHCFLVHAFEPYPRALTQLEHNLEINDLSNVYVHRVGLSNVDQVLPYYENRTRNMGAGSFEAHHQGLHDTAVSELPLVNGDDYLRTIDLTRLDLVKIDIEGFELEALEGLQNTIQKYRPVMIVELGPTTRAKVGSLGAFKSLFPEEYRFFRIVRSSLIHSERPRLVRLEFEKDCNVLAISESKLDFVDSLI